MKFSIIVPIYNISSYIDQCVESIAKQTYKDIEIILVNDGSTDDSLTILKEWRKLDERIKIINKSNGGLSSARNAGLACANGEYIVYIDGDDWVSHDFLSSIVNYIEKKGIFDLICFDYWSYFGPHDMKKVSHNSSIEMADGITFFENSQFKFTAWSKVYRKAYLDSMNLLFLEGRLHEDISYTVPLCVCARKVGWVNRPLYYYRQNRKNSIMAAVTYRNLLDFSHAICYNYYFFKEKNKLNPYIASWIMRNFYKACLTGQTNFKTLKKAFMTNNVSRIAEELGDGKMFWQKLFFCHAYMRIRTNLGFIKRLVLTTLHSD